MKRLITLISFFLMTNISHANSDESFYRQLSLRIRKEGKFKVPMPSNGDMSFSYELQLEKPLWENPILNDFSLDPEKKKFYRHFWDKVFTHDDSYIEVGGEKIPLTCIFVSGQDNRFAKDGPLIPDFVLKIYLVANDYTCVGPINPAWPNNNGKKETWDTYISYEIKDPTIMLPVEAKIRFRGVEFPAILIDSGSP